MTKKVLEDLWALTSSHFVALEVLGVVKVA